MTDKMLIVAKSEFLRTIRRRGYLFSTLILPLIFGGFLLLVAVLTTGVGLSTTMSTDLPSAKIGFFDEANLVKVDTGFIRYDGLPAAKDAFARDEIAAFFVVPPDYIGTGKITLYSKSTFSGNAIKSRIDRVLAESLLVYAKAPDELSKRILTPSTAEIVVLEAGGTTRKGQSETFRGLAFVMVIMMEIGIHSSSGYLMQGIAEEKENRRGEFLLSHLSADELLAGKVLGFGSAGLLQVAIWIACGAGIITVSGAWAILSGENLTWTICMGGIYFVLGFFLFAGSIACTAALASSAKEAQQYCGFFSMAAIFPFMLWGFVVADPNGTFAEAFSIFPYTSPFIMMMRLSVTEVPVHEILISLMVLAAGVLILARVAGKLFRWGMLMYGKSPGIRSIIRVMLE
jgi:ABC-2 type transport system permease protein